MAAAMQPHEAKNTSLTMAQRFRQFNKMLVFIMMYAVMVPTWRLPCQTLPPGS